MEYNVRTMLADDATVRENTHDAFAPCDALATEFLPSCLYWQPQWWLAISTVSDTKAQFEDMGKNCRTFMASKKGALIQEHNTLFRSCFEGIGNVVESASNFEPARARELCDALGTGDERLLCRAIGANHFGIDANARVGASVCDGLAGREYAFCLAYAENRGNVANELPLTQ